MVVLLSLTFMLTTHLGIYTSDRLNTIDSESYEEEIIDNINEYRDDNGYNRIKHSNRLSEGATEKTEEMIELNYFSHRSPSGEEVSYSRCAVTSENIARISHKKLTRNDNGSIFITTDKEEFADRYMKEILDSPDHRESLNQNWDLHGIGLRINDLNDVYVTHHMCNI
jgi:uncharacterized protein YkwD